MCLNMKQFFALRDDSRIVVKKNGQNVHYKVLGRRHQENGEILVVNLDDGSQGTVFVHWDFRSLRVVDRYGCPFDDFNEYECRVKH